MRRAAMVDAGVAKSKRDKQTPRGQRRLPVNYAFTSIGFSAAS
jgi:hypothetical protein